jgi:hypothetical protein
VSWSLLYCTSFFRRSGTEVKIPRAISSRLDDGHRPLKSNDSTGRTRFRKNLEGYLRTWLGEAYGTDANPETRISDGGVGKIAYGELEPRFVSARSESRQPVDRGARVDVGEERHAFGKRFGLSLGDFLGRCEPNTVKLAPGYARTGLRDVLPKRRLPIDRSQTPLQVLRCSPRSR